MKINNMVVVQHDDLLPETVWLIFAVGWSDVTFIDSASSLEETRDIINTIKERIQFGSEQEREEIQFLFNGEIMKYLQ